NDDAEREFLPIWGQNTGVAAALGRKSGSLTSFGRLAVCIEMRRDILNRRPRPQPRKAAILPARVYHAPPFCPFIRTLG
ncbi:MAG TPA: hypothetical protein VFK72_11455, partial [Nevskia sp.]|nr:hypothetical protein [Nevskia sp.]